MLCGIPLQTRSVKGLQTKEPVVSGQKKKKKIIIITLDLGTTDLPLVSPSRAQDLVPARAHTGVPKGEGGGGVGWDAQTD